MTEHVISFEPLPQATAKGQWGINAAIATQLRTKPGQWAHIDSKSTRASAASTAYAVRNGHLNAYAPAGTFEATSRTVNGEYRVYARYVGHDNDPTP
ncbi:hypothetical protein ACWFQ8_29980 [Streptomyces sp. NPDC055254]